MKTLLSLLSVAVLSATFSTAAKTDQDIAKLQREVTIFQRVVSTALKHDTQGQVQNVEGYYLADQGLVFDVSLRGKSMFDWRKHIEGMRDLHGFSEIPSPDFCGDSRSCRCFLKACSYNATARVPFTKFFPVLSKIEKNRRIPLHRSNNPINGERAHKDAYI